MFGGSRYELKFLLTHGEHLRLRERLRPFLDVDPSGPDGCYRVTSLYYDTTDLACYRAKRDGLLRRRKLRVRLYGRADAPPGGDAKEAFVEIKERFDRTVSKRRIVLPLEAALALCRGQGPVSAPTGCDGEPVVDEVLSMVRSARLRPACVIDYRRQAFVGRPHAPRLRVTFDRCLKYRITGLHPRGAAGLRIALSPSRVVLEIKADGSAPRWLGALLGGVDARPVRLSKYCQGMERGLDRRRTMRTRGQR